MSEPEVVQPSSSANQRATEPIPPTQAHDVPDTGGADRADAGAGTSTSPGPRVGEPGEGAALSGSFASSPGETHEVPGNASAAAEDTSESAERVDGARVTSIAREGLADGENDNAVPPTSTF